MYYDLRDCFLEATARLPLPVKGKVLACIQRFQANPRSPGLQLEKLSGRSAGLSSLRVDDQYRVILHQSPELVTLLFVAPHDDAYRFAERVPKHGYATTPNDAPTPVPSVPSPVAEPLAPHRAPAQADLNKYVPLARHLVNVDRSTAQVQMPFAQIESILGESLPPSARTYPAWWGNDAHHGHVQAKAWLSVGWRRKRVSLSRESVIFEREQLKD